LDLRDYIRVLRKHWRLVAAVLVLVVAAAAAFTFREASQYQSSVKFFVSTPATASDNQAAYTGGLFSQQRVKSYAGLLTGPRLAGIVRDDLGLARSADAISREITAHVQPDTVLLSATVTDPDPAVARNIADAVGRHFPDLVAELESPGQGKAATVRAAVVEDAKLPAGPVSPRPVRNMALATVIGLLLGVGAAVGRDALDNSIASPDDLRAIAGIATLGAIMYDNRASSRPLVVQDDPRTPRAEAFRQLRTNLQFVEVDRPLKSLVLTSSLADEGKSTSACNLAITLAQAGVRVLLLEGDLRRPRVTDYLGLEGAVGLTSVLIGQVTLADAIQRWPQADLSVLPAGPLPPNPSELLASAGMRDVMEALESTFDVVIIDAPPLLPVTDAAIIAGMASGALLCVRSGKTRREQVRRAMESLEAVGAVVLGGVLTMVPKRGPDSYGYGYGYGRYSHDTTRPELRSDVAHEAARRPARRPAPPPTGATETTGETGYATTRTE
jgi:capsular exopolysaccharide synthesis family protein